MLLTLLQSHSRRFIKRQITKFCSIFIILKLEGIIFCT
ncbi:unnamed protein product [Tenebrio molitor]|nr:unnamed protein product [Tenebrio molitor]